ncbi:MAG: hypothetical protein EA397_05815 [Deltaproteobacteria bacterium]|nr:MAG: hypothetical protein EA397_05815 [Deltaproteobacteria bacterium]
MIPSRRQRRGLSILDVMISVGILMMLSTFTVVAMQNASRLNRLMKDQDTTFRTPMNMVQRQLQLAFLTEHITAAERYRTVFVGKDGDPDSLWFATRGHQRRYRDSRESDQAEITLWAERMPRIDGMQTDGLVLYQRLSSIVNHEPDIGGTVQPIAYNVKSFNLRFLDGRLNEWRDEWDSRGADAPNMLPRAVEIGIVFLQVDPKRPGRFLERPYKNTVSLEFAQPMVQQRANQGFGR